MLVLGIETSCDETACGIVADGRRLLTNVVASQAEIHARLTRALGGYTDDDLAKLPPVLLATELADWHAMSGTWRSMFRHVENKAKVTPEQVGLPTYGPRRVKGLRREEVASLAGVSVEYYRRLERGNVSGVSELVLEGLARALQLDDAERAHLFDLTRAANPGVPRRSRPVKHKIRPVVQRGDLYRLRPPEGGLSAVQYVHGDETVVLAWLQAQRYGEPAAPLRLRGLDPTQAYECRETGEIHRGAVLLHHGLRTSLRGDLDAAVIRLRRI